MKLRLNYWQTCLLLLPFVAGHILLDSTNNNVQNPTFRHYFKVANLLTVFNIVILVSYQAHLITGFNNRLKKYRLVTFNTLIPVAFFSSYLIYVIYYTIINPVAEQSIDFGPVNKSHLNSFSFILLSFLVHSLITFFLLNNYFAATVSKKIENDILRNELNIDYYNYLKMLRKVTLLVLLSYTLISALIKVAFNT
jgi:hypothetical protein